MAKLSQAQIAMYARSAGMANPDLMAAIAMAESGGNPRAHNPVPPDNSYGLWQINMLGSMGPARRKEYGITTNTALFDPTVNARAAAKILKGQGLSAWSTYTNGAYKKYYKGGEVPADNGVEQTDVDWSDPLDILPDDAFGGVTDIAKLMVRAAAWVTNPKSWLHALYILGGSTLILMVLSASIRQQVVGAASKVMDATPVGKVGKIAKAVK